MHNSMDAVKQTDIEENFAMNMHARFKLDPLSFVMLPYLSLGSCYKND